MDGQTPTIRLAYGSCTWPHGSTRVNVYTIPTEGDNKGTRLFPNAVMTSLGRSSYQEASTTGGHGHWNFTNFDSVEGRIVLVMAQTTRNGKPWGQSAVAIRLRAEAPLRQLNVVTITAAQNLHPRVAAAVGRFDMLTVREANQLGAGLNLKFIESHMSDREQHFRMFDVRGLAPEITSKPKVRKVKVGGKEKMIAEPQRRKRKIRLRK